eukprot:TRINITY_DN10735_c0_g3_i1.p1 TRINITY_DN10735_c0_g3~~TRINITY_DN10735_c0_g3_i1.p1  ORF type:complete len:151 (-),score=43.43 TRINITY_DN10735_c0_g3_i1:128-580(-)
MKVVRRQLAGTEQLQTQKAVSVANTSSATKPAIKNAGFVPKLTPRQAQQKRAHSKGYKEREKAAFKAATAWYQQVETKAVPFESAKKVAKRFSDEYDVELTGRRIWANSAEAGCSPKPRGFKRKVSEAVTDACASFNLGPEVNARELQRN